MDYYQGVVTDYLRADRSIFVNTEFCIQLNAAENPDTGGPHWYCDAVAVELKARVAYLCEISYAKALGDMLRRIGAWNSHWEQVKAALSRDCGVDPSWQVRPWLFLPEQCIDKVVDGIERLQPVAGSPSAIPIPRITTLEAVVPWNYRSWNRKGEPPKPDRIPEAMRL